MNETDMAMTDLTMSAPTSVVSVKPVVLSAPGRGEDLHVRVSAPAIGRELPLIVFSHGFGLSLDDYDPLVDFWAAHGFVVIQPTHLDSRTLSLPPDDPRTPLIWRFRVEDMKRILDQLDLLTFPWMSFILHLLQDPGMLPGGFSWKATWKRVY